MPRKRSGSVTVAGAAHVRAPLLTNQGTGCAAGVAEPRPARRSRTSSGTALAGGSGAITATGAVDPIPLVQLTRRHSTRVNLVVSGGLPTQFWDGNNTMPGGIAFGRGGNGTWNNITTNANWTNQAGTANVSWGNGFAIFAGTAGTVTLGDNIHSTGCSS
jgi:hypothetical protein